MTHRVTESVGNGNPIAATRRPAGHHAYDPVLPGIRQQSIFDRTPRRAGTLAALETARNLSPGTLRPWDPSYPLQQQSVQILAQDLLGRWTQILVGYVTPRGGPY